MEKGSFIKINYVESIQLTGRVTDTNIESTAREAGIYHDDEPLRYTPLPVIVGSGRPVKGVDEELAKMAVGNSKDFDVAPDLAYGPRDTKLMDMVPLSFFKKQGMTPVRGLPVRTRRGLAIVRSTSGGRISLDYNHPLAGQSMHYHVEVVEEASGVETKIRWLLQMRLAGIDAETHVVEVVGDIARIELNTGDLDPRAEPAIRKLVEQDISGNLPELKEVSFGPEQPAGEEQVPSPESRNEEAGGEDSGQ